jgi:8-amino-3,8-dideoxy-alpha-D-manno-octulosonate transaminase
MSGHYLIDAREQAAVNEIFTSQGCVLFSHGFDQRRQGRYLIRETEQALSMQLFNRQHVHLVNTGTAALKVSLRAHEHLMDRRFRRIVTQSFNFIAAAEVIFDIGAEPLICASDATLNMSPKALEDMLRSDEHIDAVIATSMLGVHPDLKALYEVTQRYGVPLVLDACEALGSDFADQNITELADSIVYSFDFGKTITCGEGGAVVTRDSRLSRAIAAYKDHGHRNLPGVARNLDEAMLPGFNYRMTEMQAAVLKVQLDKLPTVLRLQRERYHALASWLEQSGLHQRCEPAQHLAQLDNLFLVELESNQQQALKDCLARHGIGMKNVPDALKWHCAYHWNHIDPGMSNHPCNLTMKECLEHALAINIDISKPVSVYQDLGREICGAIANLHHPAGSC